MKAILGDVVSRLRLRDVFEDLHLELQSEGSDRFLAEPGPHGRFS